MISETSKRPQTLQEAIKFYSDPDVCQQALVDARWSNGVSCPTCGSESVSYLKNQRRWQCKTKHPRRQFSAKVGTIFEDSPLGLNKWFAALWLIASAKNGVSSYEVHRAIGVTQKSAWFMLHRIRLAMQTGTFDKLSGEVEADETLVGGKLKNMHIRRRPQATKTPVMGLLERRGPNGHSRVVATVVEDRKKRTVQPVVRRNVEPGSAVYTDELLSYAGLSDTYAHAFVNHTVEYVRGRIHTNTAENFWGLLKRALGGTYVSVDPFHLFRYVDEEAYWFNTRKAKDGDRFRDLLPRVDGQRLTYKRLVGQDA